MNHQIDEYPDLQFGSIYCIGRNYVKHIEEMKSEKTKDPVVFLKPRSSIIRSGEQVVLPSISTNVHHEVELVALIGKETSHVSSDEALNSVHAIAVGLDLTARDLQSEAKKAGLPWTLSKGLNTFAPLGNLVNYTTNGDVDIQNLTITVHVNGEIRQSGNTSEMIFSLSEIISYLSSNFKLNPGDLIFTGTPEGVSQINKGDNIQATIGDNLSTLVIDVV
jgi:2-keto-4-pentenoate hydratase/2-oxohepta-3-ene-1,7-dioic acid hydratase in catechol pathway